MGTECDIKDIGLFSLQVNAWSEYIAAQQFFLATHKKRKQRMGCVRLGRVDMFGRTDGARLTV